MQKTVKEIISNLDLTELNEWVRMQIEHVPLDEDENRYRRLIIAIKTKLPPMYAVMMLLWVKNKCQSKKVAKMLGISYYSLWSYLSEAKRILKPYKDLIYDY